MLIWGYASEVEFVHAVVPAKLRHEFGEQAPDAILSANIGCITHLQSGTATPVRHWVEVLDEALAAP